MTIFQFQLIAGFMLGIEFPPPDKDETFLMTIDLGIVRLTVIKVIKTQ